MRGDTSSTPAALKVHDTGLMVPIAHGTVCCGKHAVRNPSVVSAMRHGKARDQESQTSSEGERRLGRLDDGPCACVPLLIDSKISVDIPHRPHQPNIISRKNTHISMPLCAQRPRGFRGCGRGWDESKRQETRARGARGNETHPQTPTLFDPTTTFNLASSTQSVSPCQTINGATTGTFKLELCHMLRRAAGRGIQTRARLVGQGASLLLFVLSLY